jgi:predicted enzyme related to lactoylglutathione lyase
MELLVNIDVDDLDRASRFYMQAFALDIGRRLGPDVLELTGASSRIYLLAKPAGSRISPEGQATRDYARHWTPVHLDFLVEDIDVAVDRARRAGATQEREIQSANWGRLALMADPFGNGFCLVQFTGRGYDGVATHEC